MCNDFIHQNNELVSEPFYGMVNVLILSTKRSKKLVFLS